MKIKLPKFATGITNVASKIKLKAYKNSPEIWMTVGIASIFGAVGAACYGTVKATTIANEAADTINTIHTTAEKTDEETYSESDKKRDLTIVYTQTAIKLAKVYAPCAALTALAVGSVFTSHKIMKKRNLALAAAYATLDAGFKEYRNNVAERFGEQVDKELRYGVKAKEIDITDKDPETGDEITKSEIVDSAELHDYSAFARVFDESNPNWEKDPEYNMMFLKSRQNWANDYLIAHKVLFLNDVYKALGFEPTKAGQVVGWVYDPNNSVGDNFVDFGIFKFGESAKRNFINGYERSIILDFNVDGNVLDKI